MNAIILYDSFGLASEANILLQRASANAGSSTDWNVTPWRTQMLRSQMFSRLALNEAADAHLVICAWMNSRNFNQWIEDWLEQWISCHPGEELAIAILGENDDIRSCSVTTELSRFSELHGVSLIIGQTEIPEMTVPGQSH
jgi:hypothetical protein